MANGRTLQRSASDPRQVRFAERKEKQHADRFVDSLTAVMRTPTGRFVMWVLLERAGIYKSVWDASGSRITYNAGRQDYGHELLASILEADDEAYQLMEREMRAWLKSEAREAAAMQTPTTGEGTNE